MKFCKHEGCDIDVQLPNHKQCKSCARNLSLYGITTPERNQILVDQDHKCLICTSNIQFMGAQTKGSNKHGAVVDHCHATGTVRGILCGKCNLLLGHAFDSVEILQSAIDYLEETQ